MRVWLVSALSMMLLAGAQVFSSEKDARGGVEHIEKHGGFIPPNELRVPVNPNLSLEGGLTETEFNQVLDRIEALYASEISARGGRLVVLRHWSKSTVNAGAERKGNNYNLHMFGGLARFATMVPDAFALVACHELGHHIGGAPKSGGGARGWASNEGQSDYFATLKCLRRFFAEDDNERILASRTVDPTAQKSCAAAHTNRADAAICVRTVMAGLNIAEFFRKVFKESVTPQLGTPDKSVASSTKHGHPKSQCRLDTYYQGALCPVPASQPVDDRDPRVGTCDAPGFQIGHRPLCWFSPN